MHTNMASMYLSLSDGVIIRSLSEELLVTSFGLKGSSLVVASFCGESTVAEDSVSEVV